MKRILGVVGSPRKKGNTHVLVDTIVAGAREQGAAAETIFLNDLQIRECDGCHACWKGRPCTKKDDMDQVYRKIADAGVIVFGTPVYWYGPTALMKAFIDRFVYFNCELNRPMVRGKGAILAIPFEEEDPQTVAPLVAFFEKSLTYLEMTILGSVIVPGVTRRGEVIKKTDFIRQASALGRASVM